MPGTVDNKRIFHLGVLIPFWVLQLLAEILIVAFSALGLAALIALANRNSRYCYTSGGRQYCYNTSSSSVRGAALSIGYGSLGASLGLGIVFLLTHITQIAMFGRKKLTPAANFGFEITRFILWTIVFILAIVSVAYRTSTIASIAFTVILWVLYLGSMIYASVIFHRSRRGKFNGTHPGGYPTAYPQTEMHHAAPGPYQNPGQYQTHDQQHAQTAQYQQPGAFQHNQYQQPGQYQQATQYQQPSQYQQPGQYQQLNQHPQYSEQQYAQQRDVTQVSSIHQQSQSGTASPSIVNSPTEPPAQPAYSRPPYPHTPPPPQHHSPPPQTHSPPPQEMKAESISYLRH